MATQKALIEDAFDDVSVGAYEIDKWGTWKKDDDGERKQLANFSAEIVEEVRYVDGRTTETHLKMKGRNQVERFAEVVIPADHFPGMGWVMSAWGSTAVITPGGGSKDDLRAAIQLRSVPKRTTVYKAIGWTADQNGPKFIHAGGAISAKGNDPNVQVRLSTELMRFDLTSDGIDIPEAIEATLQLVELGPHRITWPLLAATFVPLYGPVDFAMHVTGRTGTFKSEMISLFQSHFGASMDARHLPASWSSTPNALEAQAYYACNAPLVVDDFVPGGTSWQCRTLQANADKIIRAQGNQSGRARLTDTSHLQQTMYPRGVILSTGEDTPEGHSVRGRMMIMELTPGDITANRLTLCQKNRRLYPATTAALVQHLAKSPANLDAQADFLRSKFLEIGHSRTPTMLARLSVAIDHVLTWMQTAADLEPKYVEALKNDARASIVEAGRTQKQYLEAADPCECFCNTIRQILATGLGHLRTINGGIPSKATTLGWVSEQSMGDVPTYKSRGICLGWINWAKGEVFIEHNAGYALIKKVGGADLGLTKQTLLKRLKDAGLLTRVEDDRQRNTVRITAEEHPRTVLAMPITEVLETQEVPQDDDY